MPGTSIQLNSAAFTKGLSASLTSADRTGIVYEAILGKDAARTTRNVANVAAPGTLTGAPLYKSYAAEMSGNAGYRATANVNTNVAITGEMTFIAIVGANTLGTELVALAGGTTAFTGLRGRKNLASFYSGNGGAGMPEVATITFADQQPGQFRFLAGTLKVGQAGKVYTVTGGTSAPATVMAAGSVAGVIYGPELLIKIGQGGDVYDMAYAALYARVMTQAQIEAAYATLAVFYAGKITLL